MQPRQKGSLLRSHLRRPPLQRGLNLDGSNCDQSATRLAIATTARPPVNSRTHSFTSYRNSVMAAYQLSASQTFSQMKMSSSSLLNPITFHLLAVIHDRIGRGSTDGPNEEPSKKVFDACKYGRLL